VSAQIGLRRDDHFLPVCYQKGFTDSSGRVWVKFANRQIPKHLYPGSVGWQRNLYVRNKGGVEDDKFEDFFGKCVESPFARFCQRVKREQNRLASVTAAERSALGKFVASQVTRTLANKKCMEEQVGRSLDANAFLAEIGGQIKAILSGWTAQPPSFDFYSCLPYVEERFITGDDPIVLEVPKDNPVWTPSDQARLAITPLQEILGNPNASFTVALSPYICASLRARGGGEAHLPPETKELSWVRSFNSRIREQCGLFTLARDEECLA